MFRRILRTLMGRLKAGEQGIMRKRVLFIIFFTIILTAGFLITLLFFWTLGDPHRMEYAVEIERISGHKTINVSKEIIFNISRSDLAATPPFFLQALDEMVLNESISRKLFIITEEEYCLIAQKFDKISIPIYESPQFFYFENVLFLSYLLRSTA